MITKNQITEILTANGLTLDEDIISGITCYFVGGLPSGCPQLLYAEQEGIVYGKLNGELLAPVDNVTDFAYYCETAGVRPVAEKEVLNWSLYRLAMEGFLDGVSTDFYGKVFGVPLAFVADNNFSVTSVRETDKGRFVIAQRGMNDFTYYFAPKVGGRVKWLARKDWPSDSNGAAI